MSPKKAIDRYFVVRLSANDPERAQGYLFEVQILDSQGRAKAAGYLRADEDHLEIGGRVVSMAVIAAARRQLEGEGDYVDSEGKTIAPF